MKKLNSKLFENFKTNKFEGLSLCCGGARVGTGAPADPAASTACTKDSAELTQTAVAGQSEGTTMNDFSDYRDECGIINNTNPLIVFPSSVLFK